MGHWDSWTSCALLLSNWWTSPTATASSDCKQGHGLHSAGVNGAILCIFLVDSKGAKTHNPKDLALHLFLEKAHRTRISCSFRYLVERQSPDLWALVLTPDNQESCGCMTV